MGPISNHDDYMKSKLGIAESKELMSIMGPELEVLGAKHENWNTSVSPYITVSACKLILTKK